MTESLAQEIKDRLDIQDLMHRYARMVDRRQWELLDQVFSAEATVDYASTGGKAGSCREVMVWLDRALKDWPLNLHFISNIEIELEADRARAISYFNAPMGRQEPDGSQYIITNAGYYRDDLVRTPGGWRIAHRHCQQTMMVGQLPEGYQIPD
jgi:3-phenylpropionate/cinnamic acid dioxygenase small subunit